MKNWESIKKSAMFNLNCRKSERWKKNFGNFEENICTFAYRQIDAATIEEKTADLIVVELLSKKKTSL